MATTTTVHAPGTFCWPELMTSDGPGAKRFYTALFKWEVLENDMGPGGIYFIGQARGKSAAAFYQMNAQQKALGLPPAWNSYVAVTDADAVSAKAAELGGTIVMPAFDVMELGRMAVLADPEGVHVCLWQAKQNIGAQILGEPGALAWTELVTKDPAKAEKFYTALFGWRPDTQQMAFGPYTTFFNGDKMAGGMMKLQEQWWDNVPPHWMVYFAVADCDAAAARATVMGGDVKVAPTDIPNIGRFAVIKDPQGAFFSIIQMQQQPAA